MMRYINFVLLVSSALCAEFSQDEGGFDRQQRSSAKADFLVDEILQNLRTKIKTEGLEPFKLKDSSKTLTYNFLGFDFSFEVGLMNGSLHGLSTVKRYGESRLIHEPRHVELKTKLYLTNVKMNFNGYVKIFRGRNFLKLAASTNKVDIEVTLSQELKENASPVLRVFDVTGLGFVKVTHTGSRIKSVIISVISSFIANLAKRDIMSAIETSMKTEIQTILSNFKLPIKES